MTGLSANVHDDEHCRGAWDRQCRDYAGERTKPSSGSRYDHDPVHATETTAAIQRSMHVGRRSRSSRRITNGNASK